MNRKVFHYAGIAAIWIFWVWVAQIQLSQVVLAVTAVAGALLIIPLVLAGRRAVDRKPTAAQAEQVNGWVHYGVWLLLGTGVLAATRYALAARTWVLPLAPGWGMGLVILSSLLLLAVVINLALKGRGAPFAVALTRLVAVEWFYAWTRNPMVLAGLALLLGLGLALRSGQFLLWLLIFAAPAMVIFLLVYEERELEIRFGQAYLDYKARTPGFFPRRPK